MLIMTSVLAYHEVVDFQEIYDLKGSYVNRKGGAGDKTRRKEAMIEQAGTFSGASLLLCCHSDC